MERCLVAFAPQSSRRRGRHRARRAGRARVAGPVRERVSARTDRLVAGAPGDAAQLRQRSLVRNGQQRPRSLRARLVRHSDLVAGRTARDGCERRDRRRLGRHRGLRRRAHGRMADAHRRRAVRIAVHVLRDHPDGRLRPQPVADLHRDRRGRLAHDGPHRARAGAGAASARIRRRPPSRWASRNVASSRGTSCRTCSGRSSSTRR